MYNVHGAERYAPWRFAAPLEKCSSGQAVKEVEKEEALLLNSARIVQLHIYMHFRKCS